jgi:hypothetical protein
MTLLLEALGSIARWLLAGLMGYFVAKGVFTAEQAESYTRALSYAAAAGAVSLGWSLWQKYHSRIAFLTALDSPAGTTPAQVAGKIAAGKGAPLVALFLAVALGGAAVTSTGCAAKTAPVLTPAQKAAAVLQRVDELQNAIISTNQLTPGAIPDSVAVPIVKFCVEAAKVLKAAPDGVLPAIAAEWQSLKPQIPMQYRQLPAVSAAFIAVDIALAEFGVSPAAALAPSPPAPPAHASHWRGRLEAVVGAAVVTLGVIACAAGGGCGFLGGGA